MAQYEFLTTWLLDAPREKVWEAIYAQEHWPEWWRGVDEVEELEPGDGERLGAVSRMVWRSLLPYRVEFQVRTTRVERPLLLEADAIGELAGDRPLAAVRGRRGDRGPLRVERLDDARLDEPAGADRSPGLRVEPRLGDGGAAARGSPGCSAAGYWPAAERENRLRPASRYLSPSSSLALSSTECQDQLRTLLTAQTEVYG